MKNRHKDLVDRQRAEHHEALKQMLPSGDLRTGLTLWRKLRRIEKAAHSMAEFHCNTGLSEQAIDDEIGKFKRMVLDVFGYLPKGFFINLDPRGYALKLEAGSVPYKLYEDWGRYQILAPEIN